MMQDGDTPRRLFGLQYLRGIAATGVVIFHVSQGAGAPLSFAAYGVDLFFVLSGFLMVAITAGGARPWAFFRDRFLRVAPLYWIATAAVVVVGLLGLSAQVRLDPARIAASFAFIPYSAGGGRHTPLPMMPLGWTLNAEMLFYAIFALLLFLPRYRVLVLTCIIGGLVAAGKLFHPTGAVAIAWTDPILLDFVAGAWLGVAWVRPEHRRLIVLLLLVALLLWIPRLVWPGMRGGIEGAGATLILMAVLFFEGRGTGIPEWRPLRLLGDASYSIYLWQIFPLQFCAVVAARLHLPAAVTAAAGFALAMGGGILAYLLLERPLLAVLRRVRAPADAPTPTGR